MQLASALNVWTCYKPVKLCQQPLLDDNSTYSVWENGMGCYPYNPVVHAVVQKKICY